MFFISSNRFADEPVFLGDTQHKVIIILHSQLSIINSFKGFRRALAHHLVAVGVGMEPVRLQVFHQSLGVLRVERCLVEVDAAVIVLRGAYPLVDSLARLFVSLGVERAVFERHYCSAVHAHTLLLGLFGEESVELLEPTHGLRAVVLDAADVVHALEYYEVGHSLLRQYVAVKALRSRGRQSAAYYAEFLCYVHLSLP